MSGETTLETGAQATGVATHYDAYIGGKYRPAIAGGTFELINAGSGEPVATVARCMDADVDLAVRLAREALAEWRDTPAAERGRKLHALSEAIREDQERLIELELLGSSKTRAEAQTDVLTGVRFFEFYAGFAIDARGETLQDPPSLLSFTSREPYGVTGHISPWNAPLHSAARSLAPALAVGNTAVAKPAEEAPLTCLATAELATAVGIPDGVINVVTGIGEEAGAALAAHPGVSRISFTGSVATGKLILKAAAEHLAYVTLELGGKSANIVFDDADLELTIEGVLRSILALSGQTCAAGSRLLLQRGIYDEVVERLVERMDAYGAEGGPRLSPIITPTSARRSTPTSRARSRTARAAGPLSPRAGRDSTCSRCCSLTSIRTAGWHVRRCSVPCWQCSDSTRSPRRSASPTTPRMG